MKHATLMGLEGALMGLEGTLMGLEGTLMGLEGGTLVEIKLFKVSERFLAINSV